jgi:hypothetical protein
MKYKELNDLPPSVREYVRLIAKDHASLWIMEPVPALKGRSVLDLINEDGLPRAVAYLQAVGSKLGIPHRLEVKDEKN